jgi:hypothetical protein
MSVYVDVIQIVGGIYHIPALQSLSARSPTVSRLKVTRLAFQLFFAASTPLIHQERAFGTSNVIHMAVVFNRWVPTSRSSWAVESALRGVSPARLRRLEHRPAAIAADFMKYGFGAACAWPSVAYLLAVMATAFQRSPTCPYADVLSLNDRITWLSVLLLGCCLPLCSLLLSWAAALTTLVAAAAQISLTCSHAPRGLDVSLVANRCR